MARFAVATFVAALAAFVAASPVQPRSSGQATWYTPSDGTGACGWDNSNSQLVGAMNSDQYDGGSHCGQSVKINGDSGNSVTVKIVDECPTCGYGSIDLSPAAFKKLASLDQGVEGINWSWE